MPQNRGKVSLTMQTSFHIFFIKLFSGHINTSKINRRRFMSQKRRARVVRWYVSGRRGKCGDIHFVGLLKE